MKAVKVTLSNGTELTMHEALAPDFALMMSVASAMQRVMGDGDFSLGDFDEDTNELVMTLIEHMTDSTATTNPETGITTPSAIRTAPISDYLPLIKTMAAMLEESLPATPLPTKSRSARTARSS